MNIIDITDRLNITHWKKFGFSCSARIMRTDISHESGDTTVVYRQNKTAQYVTVKGVAWKGQGYPKLHLFLIHIKSWNSKALLQIYKLTFHSILFFECLRIRSYTYPFRCLFHILMWAGRDVGVQGFVLSRQRSPVLVSHLALFHRALSSDYYTGSCLKGNQTCTYLIKSFST